MNLAEMTARVLTIAAEEADSYWSTTDVEDAVNEGLVELADISEFNETVFSIPLLADRIYYDLRAHIPASEQFLAPRRVHNIVTNEWLQWITTRWLDARFYRQWQQVRSAPYYTFMQGLHWMGIHGSSDGDSGQLRATATTIPPPLTYPSDSPRFPAQYHLAAIEYAAYDLYVQDNEIDLALIHWKEFSALAVAFSEDVYSRLQMDRAFKFGSSTMRRYP